MWIELHDSLLNHRKISRLAKELYVTKAHARGYIVTLWLNVLVLAPDGELEDWTEDDIAECAEWEQNDIYSAAGIPTDAARLTAALVKCGFLYKENGVYCVHDWMEYAAHLKVAEKRRKARDRKRKSREKAVGHCDVTPMSHEVTPDQTRPDRPDRPDQTRTDQDHDTISTIPDLINEAIEHQWRDPTIHEQNKLLTLLPLKADRVRDAISLTEEKATRPGWAYAITILESPDTGPRKKGKKTLDDLDLDSL
jgi:hypothetical protein